MRAELSEKEELNLKIDREFRLKMIEVDDLTQNKTTLIKKVENL